MSGNPNIRIAFAVFFASLLIAGALFLRDVQQGNQAATQNADSVVVTKVPPRTPIDTLDKNNDGVPDWQEALLVTNALDMASTSEEYTPPETLTEQFSLEFFQDMVRSKNYGAFGSTPDEIAAGASEALAKQAEDVLLTEKDIRVTSDISPQALTDYTEAVATILYDNSGDGTESEAVILEQALRDQNPTELEKLNTHIDLYTNIYNQTKNLSVPSSLTQEHLNLLNAYNALIIDITAMRGAFTDPMLTLLRMKRYQDDATGLITSIINLYTTAQQQGATWSNESIARPFIELATNNN